MIFIFVYIECAELSNFKFEQKKVLNTRPSVLGPFCNQIFNTPPHLSGLRRDAEELVGQNWNTFRPIPSHFEKSGSNQDRFGQILTIFDTFGLIGTLFGPIGTFYAPLKNPHPHPPPPGGY